MNEIARINRREFIKVTTAAGGGLVLAFYLPEGVAAAEPAKEFIPNAFLRIGSDDLVTVIVNKSEMGQGVYTSLPMIIAEELDCDWRKVQVEAAPVAPEYNHTLFGSMVTGGSTSVRTEWERLALAGATAREMLVQAAAWTWQAPPETLHVKNSLVYHPDGRMLSYGSLAERAAKLEVTTGIKLKKPENYSLIGKPVHRLDSLAKVNGTAKFGIDIELEGMLVAVIARPPGFGAVFKEFDDQRAKAVKGVKAVTHVPAGVAVVAEGYWSAVKGREALQIKWDEAQGAALSTDGIRKNYAALARTPGLPAHRKGDVQGAMAAASQNLEAEYEVPYLAHATMEPLNCCVDLREDGCDIYTGTQMQTADRDTAARISGLAPEKVRIHTTFLGGGFGRRGNPASDFVAEAVQVAKAVGKPVKVIRTREDDMRAGYYRPFWYDRIRACLDAKGQLSGWAHTIVGQSIMAGTAFAGGIKEGIDPTSVEGAADIPYAVPNILVDLHSPELPITVQWWRSVGHSHTAFVVESFIDEIAHAAGRDPLEFRQGLLAGSPRHLGVLNLAAEKANWGQPSAEGRRQGIGLAASYGSYAAQVAEVSVSKEGKLRVHRIVCVVDCGRIVNPDTIVAQMESAIVFGLTATLYGEITVQKGRVVQGNFDAYPLLSIDETPDIEVHIVPSTESPGGIGEPGVPPVAPAVANALFAVNGARVRSLPITPEKVLKAVAEAG